MSKTVKAGIADKINKKARFYILYLLLVSFFFINGDCEKVLVNEPTVPAELLGNWLLEEQTGALQDICPGEVVLFQSNGIAELNCPSSGIIARDFMVEDGYLTYTQSSVKYQLEFINDNSEVWFYGVNYSRNLHYSKVITRDAKLNATSK